VALSGISFFFPTLQWLTETFGTPQMGRILHPFFGVAIFMALMFMFVRFVHHNIPDKQDIPWLKGIVEVLKGNEHKVARVGKYNAGQKMMFWTIMSMIFVLLVTGVIIWRPWFALSSRSGHSLQPADSRHLGDYSDSRHPDPYVYGILGERVD
jgi:formate dehydrogenase-N gamma subunit